MSPLLLNWFSRELSPFHKVSCSIPVSDDKYSSSLQRILLFEVCYLSSKMQTAEALMGQFDRVVAVEQHLEQQFFCAG